MWYWGLGSQTVSIVYGIKSAPKHGSKSGSSPALTPQPILFLFGMSTCQPLVSSQRKYFVTWTNTCQSVSIYCWPCDDVIWQISKFVTFEAKYLQWPTVSETEAFIPVYIHPSSDEIAKKKFGVSFILGAGPAQSSALSPHSSPRDHHHDPGEEGSEANSWSNKRLKYIQESLRATCDA